MKKKQADRINPETEIDSARSNAYWRANLWLIGSLLTVWFVVSFGCGILFVDELNSYRLYGFKLGFWWAQQGAIFVFVALIFVYVALMNRIDRRFGLDRDGSEH